MAKAYAKGYTAPSELRPDIGDAHRTHLWITVSSALIDHLVAGLAAGAAAWLIISHPALSVAPALLALVLIARQLRALENLVHEASHYNWSRHRRRVNDVLGTLLAAAPTGSRIINYRVSHLLHHGRFGTDQDPDLKRYTELRLEELPRAPLGAFARGLLSRLVRYQIGWLRELRTDALAPLGTLAWCTVCVGTPTALILDLHTGVVATAVWLTAYVFVLPPLRLVAEADEHVYSDSATVFDATVSNTGRLQRFLFHPHADGYHTVHHMWPGIPHHALRRIHRLLLDQDPTFAMQVRTRERVLQTPRPVVARVETRPSGAIKSPTPDVASSPRS